MRLASNARRRALVLFEIAKEANEFREQAIYLAQMWLIFAAIEERTGFRSQQKAKAVTIN